MLGFSQKNFPPAARPVFGVLGHLGSCLLWLWGSWALKPLGSEALGLLGCWDVQKSFFLFLGHTKCYSGTPKKKFSRCDRFWGCLFSSAKRAAPVTRVAALARSPLSPPNYSPPLRQIARKRSVYRDASINKLCIYMCTCIEIYTHVLFFHNIYIYI